MRQLARACLVLALLVRSTVCAVATDLSGINPYVTIRVYNDVQLSEKVLAEAEQEAVRIFHQAGVNTIWIECQSSRVGSDMDSRCQYPPGLTHLALRIVPRAWSAGDSIFGVAFLSAEGNGAYGDVFYDSVEKLHREWRASVPRVLGHVMAHEIGHLLLGLHSHSRLGIMCPSWHGEQLRSIGMGTLFFMPEQARSIRTRLSP